jgi:hypothetical protein
LALDPDAIGIAATDAVLLAVVAFRAGIDESRSLVEGNGIPTGQDDLRRHMIRPRQHPHRQDPIRRAIARRVGAMVGQAIFAGHARFQRARADGG